MSNMFSTSSSMNRADELGIYSVKVDSKLEIPGAGFANFAGTVKCTLLVGNLAIESPYNPYSTYVPLFLTSHH